MEKISALIAGDKIYSNSEQATELYLKSKFGLKDKNKVVYTDEEAMYLVEKEKMQLFDLNYKQIQKERLLKRMIRRNKRFNTRYQVFTDLRDKGHIVKSALKFGGDFRVYDKGDSQAKKHSRWICFVESEKQNLSMQDFVSKNRVAHSTKKNLLLAIVDSEEDVSYFEVSWKNIK